MKTEYLIGAVAIIVTIQIFLFGGLGTVIKYLIDKLLVNFAKEIDRVNEKIEVSNAGLEKRLDARDMQNERSHKELWQEIGAIKQAHAKNHGEIIGGQI